MNDSDTIAAIATPPGAGGIGIIRISGSDAKRILYSVFCQKSGKKIEQFEDRHLYYGIAIDSSLKTIDECMAVYMKSPKSYTREDVAEIHCHGGMIPIRAILDEIIKSGARLAQPGEFTKRAFLNGRIDLTQAEAVMDMISATTKQAAEMSAVQMEGKLGEYINSLKEKLLDISAEIEASVDYPDDVSDGGSRDFLLTSVAEVRDKIDELLKSYEYGRILSQGLKVAITGKPNVGKSSLLNALLKANRAIVTPIPGTTRDVIEEMLNVKGVPVKISDAAGIRKTSDIVENIGIERARKNIDEADVVIMVCDASNSIDCEDKEIIELLAGKRVIYVLNKIDLGDAAKVKDLRIFDEQALILRASIKNDAGVNDIEEAIADLVYSERVKHKGDMVIVNARQKQALTDAFLCLSDALLTINSGFPIDMASIDIREAWRTLASITGESVGDELIDRIFSRFCLGK
jgi:tRNA modification GTPase